MPQYCIKLETHIWFSSFSTICIKFDQLRTMLTLSWSYYFYSNLCVFPFLKSISGSSVCH